jgi:hypothetical protein
MMLMSVSQLVSLLAPEEYCNNGMGGQGNDAGTGRGTEPCIGKCNDYRMTKVPLEDSKRTECLFCARKVQQ